jgi:hypothetical protein
MRIKVEKIFYRPKTEIGKKIDIFGMTYYQIVNGPNLYVIKTDEELKEGQDIQFELDNTLYSLYKICPVKKDDMTFVECRRWEESVETPMTAKQILEKYKISRRTLTNWVRTNKIRTFMNENGRYTYFDKNTSVQI